MTLNEFLINFNSDLKNEYKHMLFYVHAANVLLGMERLYLADKLKAHATSEMEHIYQFAHKVRAYGGMPFSGLDTNPFAVNYFNANAILNYALKMEKEVVANYHERHVQATQLWEDSGRKQYYDFVIFLEEQIEHSQHDIDELVQILVVF